MNVVILHPGEMGVTVGTAVSAQAKEVRWVRADRSQETHSRAKGAGLVGYETVADALDDANVVFSVCPPHAADDVAGAVAKCGYKGLYVDANAVSPQTTRRIEQIVTSGGASFVDGGIIGPPAHKSATTRLYVSGRNAEEIVTLFRGSLLECKLIAGGTGAASALKMSYAAWAKGSTALLLGVRALSRAYGVESALCEEWDLSRPDLRDRSSNAATGNAFKAWRFEGEMREIADSFAAVDIPEGFHQGAAEVYARLAGFKGQRNVDPDAILDAIRKSR